MGWMKVSAAERKLGRQMLIAVAIVLATLIAFASASAAQTQQLGDTETQRLASPERADGFGTGMSIDGNLMAIGAPFDETVYIYGRTATSWVQQFILEGEDGSRFGDHVALSGDTLAVVSSNGEGSVSIFTRRGATNWIEQQVIPASETDRVAGEGFSIDLDGDTLVIGDTGGEVNGLGLAGAAHVWTRSGNTWRLQQTINASEPEIGNRFAWDISLSGDTLFASEFRDSLVRVFERSGNTWSEIQTIDEDRTGFARSVSVDGDVAVLGSTAENQGAGSAYVYERAGTGWSLQQTLQASDGLPNDLFGQVVSVDGGSIAVSAPFVGPDLADGAVYTFEQSGSTWSESGKFSPSGTDTAETAFILGNLMDFDDGTVVAFSTSDGVSGLADTVFIFNDGFGCNGFDITVDIGAGDRPTAGDDVILGTEGDDVINAGDGRDSICGLGGDDTINAGFGADVVFAGPGADTVFAGQGLDIVYGEGGADFISGGKGKDVLNGGNGNDDIRGNEGTDTLNGGAGNDELRGGQKADLIFGGDGDDNLVGGTRPDIMNGGLGIDTYNGGGGADSCLDDPDNESSIILECEQAPRALPDNIIFDPETGTITIIVIG